MNSSMRSLFFDHNGRRTLKWDHYLEIYDRHLSRFRGKEVHLLEFGIYEGGSLQLWKNYFGPRCRVYGVDINPYCKKYEEEQIQIFIGDQGDRSFLRSLRKKIPKVDILIDDGGHRMEQQIATFEEMIEYISCPGVYICEDTHTSYMTSYGGGENSKNTYTGYTKQFIDLINSWHLSREGAMEELFKSQIGSLHFYDSVTVIEKMKRTKPFQVEAGMADPEFQSYPEPPGRWIQCKIWLRNLLVRMKLKKK